MSHFRKVWPQGVIDNSDGDSELIDSFLVPLSRKKEKKVEHITYPWEYDKEEVVRTQKSLDVAEAITKKKLSMEAVKNGGLGMIFEYDNAHGAFERNTPYGNTWWKPKAK